MEVKLKFNKRKSPGRRLQWTKEEDELIMDLHLRFGGNWRKIGEAVPSRPVEAIKNRFYSSLKKRSANEKSLVR